MLVFEGNFQVEAPGGAYIRRGDLTEGFLRYEFGGPIFGGAYTWRGLFSEFYGMQYSVYIALGCSRVHEGNPSRSVTASHDFRSIIILKESIFHLFEIITRYTACWAHFEKL